MFSSGSDKDFIYERHESAKNKRRGYSRDVEPPPGVTTQSVSSGDDRNGPRLRAADRKLKKCFHSGTAGHPQTKLDRNNGVIV